MKLKKILCAGLTAAMIFTGSQFTSAAGSDSASGALAKIEIDTYGVEQDGPLIARVGRLEKDYSGKNMQGNLNMRISSVSDLIYKNSGAPSIMAKVNALEWNVKNEVVAAGIAQRIAGLENVILGTSGTGTFAERIKALAKESFGDENIPMIQVRVPAGTLIKVATAETLNTRTLQVGDTVPIKVSEDVIISGNLIFAKGLRGEGKVVDVKSASRWGRNGKMDIDFDRLECIDGEQIKICVGDEAEELMTQNKMVDAGALVGLDLKDDWKKATVHGKNLEIPAGTEFYVQLKQDEFIYALQGGASIKIAPGSNVITVPSDEEEVIVVEEEGNDEETVEIRYTEE